MRVCFTSIDSIITDIKVLSTSNHYNASEMAVFADRWLPILKKNVTIVDGLLETTEISKNTHLYIFLTYTKASMQSFPDLPKRLLQYLLSLTAEGDVLAIRALYGLYTHIIERTCNELLARGQAISGTVLNKNKFAGAWGKDITNKNIL